MEARVLKLLVSVCVMLSAAMQAASTKSDSKSSRQLYEQAAKAIVSADSRAAITPLEQLIEDQPTSSLACIAAVHLAECYIACERESDAAALLEKWSGRIAIESKTTKLDANLDAHHLRVWLQAAKGIRDDSAAIDTLEKLTRTLESRIEPNEKTLLQEIIVDSNVEHARRLASSGKLELAAIQLNTVAEAVTDASSGVKLLVAVIHQQLANHSQARKVLKSIIDSEQKTPSQAHARLELATYAMQDREIEVAATLLRPIIEAPQEERNFDAALDCRFRILWSELEMAQGNASRSLEVLPSDKDLAKLDKTQQIAVRFSRAEAAAQAGKHALALGELRWLSEYAQRVPNEPSWAVTVALRQCELLLKTKDYAKLTAVIEDAKKRFSKFERLHEFDYLLARAAMLQIEFDQARGHLRAISESAAAKSTSAAARAQWMLGETYFLEQNFREAIIAYEQVTEQPESQSLQPWQTLALMQTAKCYELLSRSSEALEAYHRVVVITKDEKIRQEAAARIEVIERTATRTKPPSLR